MAYPGVLCKNGDMPAEYAQSLPVAVTVAVCTRNRPQSLKRALASVLAQAQDAPGLEILVADNGEGCDTANMVESMPAGEGCLRLVREPEPGLSAARNRAWREAAGRWIVYIDDDAELVPGYLAALSRLLAGEGDRAGALGGPIAVGWENGPPSWYEPGLDQWCNRLDLGPVRREILWPETLYGTNMAFDVRVLESLGGFRGDLGRRGEGLLDAEETELFIRMEKLASRPVIYYPALKVIHYMTEERLSPDFFLEKARWHGKSLAALERLHPDKIRGLGNAFWVMASSCFRTASGRGRGALTERVLRTSAWGYLEGRFLKLPH